MLIEQHQVESDMSGPDEQKYSLRKSLRQFLDKQKSLSVTLCCDGSDAAEVYYKLARKRILGLFWQSFTKCIKYVSYVFFIPE